MPPGGSGGDIILSAIIEHPAQGVVILARPAQTVLAGRQSVEELAATQHSDAAAIRWANGLSGYAEPAPGTSLLVPPGPGALVPVLAGERPSQFALRLHLDPRVVLDYNLLTRDDPRPAGSYLQVPLGAAPAGALVGRFFTRTAAGLPAVTDRGGPNGFPYGQCTYYIAGRRTVTWGGNAIDWWWNANGIRPEGHTPVAGAIAVYHNGWFGHVAYVESVNPDGSYVVTEMNYWGNGGGWGRIDRRTVGPGDRTATGFIY